MTWKLIRDGETIGEWSDDLIDKTVKKLKIMRNHHRQSRKTFKRKVSP